MGQLPLASKEKLVISMSRRTDMAWYPETFCRILEEKYSPEKVHTIVVWTKFPKAILTDPYLSVLSKYDQIYVHLTITGLGGTAIEPNVPKYKQSLKELPELIDFLGTPDRLRIRPDPIIKVKKSDKIITNYKEIEDIIITAANLGVKTFSTSFCYPYGKVIKRLKAKGFDLVGFTDKEQIEILNELSSLTSATVYACNIPGFPTSKCIDGELLSRLHPQKESCSILKAKNQRPLCGCTHSIDIGWYDMYCKSGCLYCYANTKL